MPPASFTQPDFSAHRMLERIPISPPLSNPGLFQALARRAAALFAVPCASLILYEVHRCVTATEIVPGSVPTSTPPASKSGSCSRYQPVTTS